MIITEIVGLTITLDELLYKLGERRNKGFSTDS